MRTNINKVQFLPLPVVVIGTYDKAGKANAMTAAWATMYDVDKILIVIDKSHKTAKNLKLNKDLSVAFATAKTWKYADYVGCVSGNDKPNKTAKLSISKAKKVKAPIFNCFPVALECRLLSYKDEIAIVKVLSINIDKAYLKNNKIDYDKLSPITYDSTTNSYRVVGKRITKAFITKKI